MSKTDNYICCFCDQEFVGKGHNPDPVEQYPKRCCEECNAMIVIPARITLWKPKNEKDNSH